MYLNNLVKKVFILASFRLFFKLANNKFIFAPVYYINEDSMGLVDALFKDLIMIQ